MLYIISRYRKKPYFLVLIASRADVGGSYGAGIDDNNRYISYIFVVRVLCISSLL